MDTDQLFDRFVALLDDPETRDAGLCGLAHLGDPRYFTIVTERLDREAAQQERLYDLDDDRDDWQTPLGALELMDAERAKTHIHVLVEAHPELYTDLDYRLARLGDRNAGLRLLERLKRGSANDVSRTISRIVAVGDQALWEKLADWLPDNTKATSLWTIAVKARERTTNRCVALLLQTLQNHRDWSERFSAATGLAEVGTSETIAALTRCLLSDDEDRAVRSVAAHSLGPHIEFDTALELLVRKQTADRRVPFYRLLGRIGDERAVPYLIESLNPPRCPEDPIDLEILQALAEIGGNAATAVLLERLLTARDVCLLPCLTRLGSPQAIAPLLDCMEAISNDIRLNWIDALASSYRSVPSDEVESRFITDTRSWHRLALAKARIRQHSSSLPETLLQWLKIVPMSLHTYAPRRIVFHGYVQGGPTPSAEIIEALGEHGNDRALEPLLGLLDRNLRESTSEEDDISLVVAGALGKIGRRMRESQATAGGIA